MSGFFSEEIIEEIRSRIDIVELIGEYVDLRKQGNRFVGRCPFHSDRTPSFHVTPENGLFYCFGCGTGGDLFSFVMKADHSDFPQAVEKLARRAGISLAQERALSPSQRNKLSELDRLRDINREAALYYFKCLRGPMGEAAREYLAARQVNSQCQQVFALGYAPGKVNSLQSHLAGKSISQAEMIEAGLLVKREDGSLRERFRNRLMFPITDNRGRVVGFGGRLLAEGQPKYLNSPETKIFRKKGLLYGLHLASPSLRERKTAILVEGYLDVIALYQYGFANAVASLGTAFTPEHGSLLKRYVQEVILLFDNDEAGIRATDRAIEIFRNQGLKVKIIILPKGQDPDDFLQAQGKEAFDTVLANALSIIPYRLMRLKSQYPLSEPGGKSLILGGIFPDLAKLTSQVERQEYIRFLAQELDLDEEAIWDDFTRKQRERQGKTPYSRDKTIKIRNNTIRNTNSFRTPYLMAQKNLLRLILQLPQLTKRIEEELGEKVFSDEMYKDVYRLIKEVVSTREEETISLNHVLDQASENHKSFIAKFAARDSMPIDDRQIEDTIKTLRWQYLAHQVEEKRRLIKKAEEAKDSFGVQNMLQEINDLQRKIHTLK